MNKLQNNKQNPYRKARDRFHKCLADSWNAVKFRRLGAEIKKNDILYLDVLNSRCRLSRQSPIVTVLPENREIDLMCQVLVLDYLTADSPVPPARMLSFSDFSEARGYIKPFQGRVIQRMTYTVAADKGKFVDAAERIGGLPAGKRPLRYLFKFFPLFEIQVVRYEADDDFPRECNLFFSDNALQLLSVESLIVSAEKLVSILEGKNL